MAETLLKTPIIQRNITTNTTPQQSVIITGWHWIPGVVSTSASQAVSFGVTFASKPIVIIGMLGFKDGSDPTSIDDFVNTSAAGYTNVQALAISTTGFTAYNATTSNMATSERRGFSWIAIGKIT